AAPPYAAQMWLQPWRKGADGGVPARSVEVEDRAEVAGDPDVVRAASPDGAEIAGGRDRDDLPALRRRVRPVTDRPFVADCPDVVRAGAPYGSQIEARLGIDLGPLGRCPARARRGVKRSSHALQRVVRGSAHGPHVAGAAPEATDREA